MICVQVVIAQKIDTTFYDANWKGVPTKAMASFMRIAITNDSQSSTIKDYYITGELQSEGLIPVYIDKNDDKKSKFKGHSTSYYKSGQKQSEYYKNDSCQFDGEAVSYHENGNPSYKIVYKDGVSQEETDYNERGLKITLLKGIIINGKFEGERTEFHENGLRKNKGTIKDGKWEGTFYQFNVDGSYAELEYKDGQPKKDYILVGLNGKRTKMKLNNQ